ncbi:MAG TPA: cytochrome P450, partial [Pirellulales bacterium]|nr:cytochrome P450 [Pirellulales bacterium]
MFDFFSDDVRRDPYPLFKQVRQISPVVHVPPPFDGWLIFDYETVKWAVTDHATFSSRVPAPPNWFVFSDPPIHSKQRALISRAFTPSVVANLEPWIRQLSQELLDPLVDRGEMDLVADYAVPLPMKVIARLIGIPPADWERFRRWSDGILKISFTRADEATKAAAFAEFQAATIEMDAYLVDAIAERRRAPADDLLTRLIEAEVDGERLTHEQILGFFQLLVVGGQETTANLISNAVLSLVEHPEQLARLLEAPALLPSAIEETLRFRSPFQWLMRTPTRDIELHGQTIPAGKLVLPMIGSANRDERQFPNPEQFDIAREPNPHIAFGQGIHSCLGAPLARLEARIA